MLSLTSCHSNIGVQLRRVVASGLYSKLRNVTPLISWNPREWMCSIQILLLIVKFPSFISWGFDMNVNHQSSQPTPSHGVTCHYWNPFISTRMKVLHPSSKTTTISTILEDLRSLPLLCFWGRVQCSFACVQFNSQGFSDVLWMWISGKNDFHLFSRPTQGRSCEFLLTRFLFRA